MKKEEITALFGKFESISCEVEGIECWSARELQPLLGYAKWDNFINNSDEEKRMLFTSMFIERFTLLPSDSSIPLQF